MLDWCQRFHELFYVHACAIAHISLHLGTHRVTVFWSFSLPYQCFLPADFVL